MTWSYTPETFAYIIQPDDTVWDLAERYDTPVEVIFAVNPGVDPNHLIVGQVIAMPGDPPSAREPRFEQRRRAELERRRRRELERRRRAELNRRRREELEHRRGLRVR
jgi:LysM repeat protein